MGNRNVVEHTTSRASPRARLLGRDARTRAGRADRVVGAGGTRDMLSSGAHARSLDERPGTKKLGYRCAPDPSRRWAALVLAPAQSGGIRCVRRARQCSGHEQRGTPILERYVSATHTPRGRARDSPSIRRPPIPHFWERIKHKCALRRRDDPRLTTLTPIYPPQAPHTKTETPATYPLTRSSTRTRAITKPRTAPGSAMRM